jgi:hypothetical protein
MNVLYMHVVAERYVEQLMVVSYRDAAIQASGERVPENVQLICCALIARLGA